ncbi:DNA-binding response regulator, OmpR family, contains REC and winged-helix (wHTH) domain [Desulfonispora thiosulfatigenes DSM 11270]|uniref:Stage 0 sporulation protein A homolog n=1 Tax=Desulfonispora thiosulfatigenes DSM 11270 TaxID=656914 RepID=A0A1W1UPA6_DESTI|nr:response regulator transcription factor [Desulfonispora thiosulfatigenes]SMB82917.1 DNA-binding response regulator, OmpR family, contains REC and winged-helix (wHTH) domain [Desulfonispora thiosulfatigenes DSM 11270]
MKKILIIEDEPAISRVLKLYLEKEKYQVFQEFNGDEAVQKFASLDPDLVLLDIMLPNKDGWSILEDIRQKSSCPVIMLSALGQIDNKLKGLKNGADDYITKPFIAEEVIERVRAVLRRSAHEFMDNEDIRYFGNLKVDFKSHRIFHQGLELTFIPRDLSLIIFFAKHPNQTFTREQLIDNVWGIDFEGSDRAVDLAIKRIRNILKNWASSEGTIKTIRGLGYQFCVKGK